MFTPKLITVFLLIGSVSGNNLRIEDGVQVEDNAEAVPDEIEIDASAEVRHSLYERTKQS